MGSVIGFPYERREPQQRSEPLCVGRGQNTSKDFTSEIVAILQY